MWISKDPQNIMRLLLACFFILLSCGVAVAQEVDQQQAEENPSCSFYCILQPHPTVPLDINKYKNLSCTHLIYGLALIDSNYKLVFPSNNDIASNSSTQSNLNKIQTWRDGNQFDHPIKKLYLGIFAEGTLHFISNSWTQGVFADEILAKLKANNFDGIFLHLESYETWFKEMKEFLQVLRTKSAAARQNIDIIMTLSSKEIGKARRRLPEIGPLIDAIYLLSDESPATEYPSGAVAVDPLHASDDAHIGSEDTISDTANQIAMAGVPEEKIIVGLSTWARSYRLLEGQNTTRHGDKVAGPGAPGKYTHRKDGKISYYEVCTLMNDQTLLTYDNTSETVSFVSNNTWYSLALPDHDSFKNKIKWVAEQNFKGIGISSLVSDDRSNWCNKGTFPLHETVKNEFKCKVKRKRRDLVGDCTRMCSFQPREGEQFEYKNFKEDWCSHMILLSADLQPFGGVKASDLIKDNIKTFEKWSAKEKPRLILSIGGSQTKDIWRMAIGNPNRRTVTVRSITMLVKEHDLDGIDISWTESSPETVVDSNTLASFLAELRSVLSHKEVIVSVTPQFTYNAHFNAEVVSKSVNYFLLQGYKFHSYNKIFTGHHSPLFSSSEILSDPKMTIEGLSFDWVSRGIPAEKLIIGLSAEGMGMFFQNHRAESYIGAPANTFRSTMRVGNTGSVSQSDICLLLQQNDTRVFNVEELGVPYLTQGDRFVAFDDERSIQTKAIWASLNNFGGLNLHGIEMDNMYGECPEGEPFPLLQTLVKSQVCDYCGSKALVDRPKKSECVPDFQVACSYQLPKASVSDALKPDQIPFDKCTEILIDDASLTSTGEIVFSQADPTKTLEEIVKLAKEKGNRRVVVKVQCQMNPEQFTKLMDQRSTLIGNIGTLLTTHKLKGIELSCDQFITPQNRDAFTQFLKELKTTLTQSTQEPCPPTVSLRIPVWNSQISQTYDIETLNSLDRIVLETFLTSTNTTQLVSPLFSTEKDNQLNIDSVLHSWLKQGIKRESLLLHIPGYGILQHLTIEAKVIPEPGSQAQKDFIQFVTQRDICLKINEEGVRTKVMYDLVSAFSVTPKQEWISYETQSTITYKMKYAIREGLAGIGLTTINDDDYTNVCKQGMFPLLKTINRNICPVSK